MSTAGTIAGPRRATDVLLAVVLLLAATAAWWWAVTAPRRTLHGRDLPPPATQAGIAPSSLHRTVASKGPPLIAFDPSAFHAPLWIVPPSPPTPPVAAKAAPEPPPPPPPPLRWQLLAIVTGREDGASPGRSALLFDPETDSLLELNAGQEHGGKTVERISANSVAIRFGKAAHILRLDPRTSAEQGGGKP